MSTESLRQVKDRFSEFVHRVELHHERVTVTRDGRPAAVLISPEDLASLEETLDLLSDPQTLVDLADAGSALERGDAVYGVDAVRALLPRP
ncbi:MAG: type II toxin-antitoxin system Phd/YefM family antitoxin [Acidimicrobiales bacterium]